MFRKKRNEKLILKSLLLTAVFLGLGSGLLFADFASAQNCPANTTVSGTTVLFVGELTDMGGDASTLVWFEYGQSTAYGQTTVERNLTVPGFYCITVTGLTPNTTYYYRAAAKNSAGTSYGAQMSFLTKSGPTVDLKVNGSNGPITVDHNSSVSLSWISSNVNSCSASGDWSSVKAITGSQAVSNLTSSKTYTLTCSGPAGSASDSVTVNVGSQPPVSTEFTIKKTVRNLSKGTVFADSIQADPTEVLVFGIVIQAGNTPLDNVIVKDTLPAGIVYRADLKVDNVSTSGDILNGLNIGTLAAGQKKTITFRSDVAAAENFNLGQTELINTVLVTSGASSVSDTAKIIVNKGTVAGAATDVTTGLTNNMFLDSFLLPLIFTLLIVWLLKSRIIKVEEWMDARKKEYHVYKSKKVLQMQIGKIKAQELFRRIV